MKRLINERVDLRRSHDTRYWRVNKQWHRNDDGPSLEDVINNYCEWYFHGNFFRSNDREPSRGNRPWLI